MLFDKAKLYSTPVRYSCASVLAILLALGFSQTQAATRYYSVDEFLQKHFADSNKLAMNTLWFNKALKQNVADILGHPLSTLRLRYWSYQDQTAWVLEEIGKEQPITLGLVVGNNGIVGMDILEYREPRGGEVRHDFFKAQFSGVQLTKNNRLNRHIDGISGATLSVRAVNKMARLALFLHDHLSEATPSVGQ